MSRIDDDMGLTGPGKTPDATIKFKGKSALVSFDAKGRITACRPTTYLRRVQGKTVEQATAALEK